MHARFWEIPISFEDSRCDWRYGKSLIPDDVYVALRFEPFGNGPFG